ncbi:antitoxin [Streptomyces sp. NBC_01288]|uniref:antitoxin n=1 Tax=unclassified Streptomyces TaxID=2593676 RepID=UPI002E128639|nr:antitoxin [Streptomyces sp. NBC_01288]
MGLMDSWKAKLAPAKDKVSGLAQQHGGKIENGLDKAAKMVDEKTKGKYSDKIQTGTGKAKDAMDRLAHQGDTGSAGSTGAEGSGTTTPPDPTPPAS